MVLALAVAVAVTAACKKEGDGHDDEHGPRKLPPSALSAEKPPAAFDPTTAKVALPETQAKPEKKKVDFGGTEVTVEVCALDTLLPPMADKSWDRALPSMTVAADGTLYVLDPENKLRHYVNRDPRGCELVLDKKFGDGGLLDAGLSDGYSLAADGSGAIYATSGGIGAKSKKIVGEKVEDHCSGFLRTQPSSKVAVLSSSTVLTNGCEGTSVSFYKGFDPKAPTWAAPRVVGLYGDEIVVRGMDVEKGKEVRKIGLYATDGKQRLKLGKVDGPESMWSPDLATTCAGDLCVFDVTRGGASILRWKNDGKFVSKLRLDVVDISGSSLGVAGDSLWIGGGAAAKGPGIVGVILRVSGVK